MSSIITITFSPCIDKGASVNSLIPEKKLRCSIPKLEPGGGGINVARAIKKLGGEAIAIYPAGGYTGKCFLQLMKKDGITSVVVETEDETRENIIILEESTNQQFRFGMPGTPLHEPEWQKILYELEAIRDPEFIVVSGSLPPGVPAVIFTQIGRIAKSKRAKFILDVFSEALNRSFPQGVYLIKPNLGELSSLVNKEYLLPDQIAPAAQQIIQSGYCEVVITSMGADGAMLITKDIVQTIKAPPAQRKSTVGAGDSMLAGIVFSLFRGRDIKDAAQYGVACGTAATMNPGTELCKLKDVEILYKVIRGLPQTSSVTFNHPQTG
jgi:6-phosphofructokinase 2